MVALIKSGAFDKVDYEWASKISTEPRYAIMAYYLSIVSQPKKKLTLQNLNGLIEKKIIPNELLFEQKTYAFNKYLKEFQIKDYYYLPIVDLDFYEENYHNEGLEIINSMPCIKQKTWDKIYQTIMNKVRDWLKENQELALLQYNDMLFQEYWDKYANGNISAWEMESVCFYSHEHELAHIDKQKYGIVNFFDLSYDAEINYFIKRNNNKIPIYKLYKIAGTIISRDNTKSTVTILTTDGVVPVKFTKEYYAMFNRQISEIQTDGSKKILEKGWFSRGVKIMVTGYRREDTFVAKKYKATPTHQLYKITNVKGDSIELEHERVTLNE
jgi:DNA polymerase-3 subunit alpha